MTAVSGLKIVAFEDATDEEKKDLIKFAGDLSQMMAKYTMESYNILHKYRVVIKIVPKNRGTTSYTSFAFFFDLFLLHFFCIIMSR